MPSGTKRDQARESGGERARPWLPEGAAELRKSGEAVLGRLRGLLDNALEEVQGAHPPVTDVMSRNIRTCTDDDTLDAAARVMWENDCGCVPVVTGGDRTRVIGMLTDRDISMAAYTTGRRLADVRVASARSRQAWCCPSSATVDEALAIMRERRVHRLPVVDAEGSLVGLVSLSDVAMQRRPTWRPRLLGNDIAETFTEIRERRR